MGRLLTLLGKGSQTSTRTRAFAANNSNLPYTYNTSSNWCHNSATTHITGPEAVTDPELFFTNGLLATNGEPDAYYDFTLRCGILYNGVFYPAYDALNLGNRDASIAKTWGLGRYRVTGLTIPAATPFKVINRRVANDGATALQNVTGVTNATTCVVTFSGGHSYLTGEQVAFATVGGTTQLNGVTYTVRNPTATTIDLWNSANTAVINSTAYGVYTSGGTASRQYFVLASTSGIRARQDGSLGTTNSTNDFTLGVGLAYGAVAGVPPITGGVITSGIPVTAGGTGYAAGVSSDAWCGPAGVGAAGATQPGSGYSGAGNRTGAVITSITTTAGGTNYSAANPPIITLGGGGSNSFGTGNQASYGPCLITGSVAGTKKGLIVLSDSNEAGYGAADGTGNLNGSHGAIEQRLNGLRGIWKLCRSGDSAAGWNANNTKRLALIDAVKATGVDIGDTFIGLAGNDFGGGGLSIASVKTHVGVTIATMKAKGARKIFLKTMAPNTTSTDAFITTANQTAFNAAYGVGGDVLTYNSQLRANTSGLTYDGLLDVAIWLADSVDAWRWRTAGTFPLGAVTGTAFTDDGPHYSKGVGIPYLVNNLDVSAIA